MLRRLIRAASLGGTIFVGIVAVAYAWMRPQWGSPLANESALAYNQTYAFQTNNAHIDSLSFQCVYTSATLPTTTFTGAMLTANSSVIAATNSYTTANAYQGQKGAIGFQVLFSTNGAASAPSPLINQTTYYVIPVDVNDFKLATTSTGAVAGTAIVLTSTGTAGAYKLTPLAITGTPSFKWQVSNDGTTWNDLTATPYNVAISSITMSAYTFGGASTVWDFGPFNYVWVRLNVIAPTAGGIQLKCTPNGEGQTAND